MDKNVRRDILSINRVSKLDAGTYYGFALNMGNADATGTGVQSDQAELRVIGTISLVLITSFLNLFSSIVLNLNFYILNTRF